MIDLIVQKADIKSNPTSIRGLDIFDIDKNDVVGWFSNNFENTGWILTKLTDFEQKEFNPKNKKGIFRSYNHHGSSIVMINIKTGKFSFIDNVKYEEDPTNIKFNRMTKAQIVRIDYGKEAFFL